MHEKVRSRRAIIDNLTKGSLVDKGSRIRDLRNIAHQVK